MARIIKHTNVLMFLSGLVLGVFVCWLVVWLSPHTLFAQQSRGSILRQHDPEFLLVSPLLAAEVGTEASFPELDPVKTAMMDVINQSESQEGVKDVSVYYRLLNSARWFEINGTTSYAPASLLKVFVMVAFYAESENLDEPTLLQKEIRFEGSANMSADKPGEVIPHLVSGKYYSVEDVIAQMIVYSDNDALNTLLDNFDPSTLAAFKQIFTDLKIPSPTDQKESSFDFLSVEQYSLIFRVLYSTTYLTPRHSQQALDLLSRAHYTSGLVAGVPKGVTVAHKFGVTTDPATRTTPAEPELHDCGIVYYPGHPYLMCVMTRGSDFASLQSVIKQLSGVAYQQTNKSCSTATKCFSK